MKKLIYSTALSFLIAATTLAQTTIAAFDFNGAAGYPVSAASTASNITASINGTDANAVYSGTSTGSGAFTQNTTAGDALSMANSSGTNTRYWTVTLGGSDLNKYINYKVYFQSEHSTTGATVITISYSTDGSTYTPLSQTVAPGLNTTFTEAIVDLSGITTINNQTAVYIRFAASGASGTGTLRIDNLEIQAATSPWTMNGGNVNFTGGVTATSFTTTGNARVNGGLTSGAATVSSISNTGNLNVAGTTTLTGAVTTGALTSGATTVSSLSSNGNISTSGDLSTSGSFTSTGAATINNNLNVAGTTTLAGNTRILGSLTTNTLSSNVFDVSQQLTFGGGQKQIGVYTFGTTSILSMGGAPPADPDENGGSGPHPHEPSPCLPPLTNMGIFPVTDALQIQGQNISVGAKLTMGFDGTRHFIEGTDGGGSGNASANALFLNYFCGKDVNLSVGGLGNGGSGGGFVFTGPNIQIGNVNSPRRTNTALNIGANGTVSNALNINGNGNDVFKVGNDGTTTIPILAAGTSSSTGLYRSLFVDATGKLVSSANTITGNTGGWDLTGNSGTDQGTTNFLGTTDNKDVVFKTNGIEHMRIGATALGGKVLIGGSDLAVTPNNNNIPGNWDDKLIVKNAIRVIDDDVNTSPSKCGLFGNDGVHTYIESYKLDVEQPGTIIPSPDDIIIGWSSGANVTIMQDPAHYTSGGYLGVQKNIIADKIGINMGITDPQAKIHINSASSNHAFRIDGLSASVFSVENDGTTLINSTSSSTAPFTLKRQGSKIFQIQNSGLINIGPRTPDPTKFPNAMLTVDGAVVVSQDIWVADQATGGWADYVFKKEYKLTPLLEVEKFIKENGHLNNVPSAAEIKETGQNLGKLQVTQMEKIEELTLYMIELNKKIEVLQKENEELKKKIK